MSSTVENQNPAKSIDVECDVTKILEEMGFSDDSDAFGYLRTAIILTVNDSDVIDSVTKIIYSAVANQYQTTESRVQSAMTRAIKKAWKIGDAKILNSYFGNTIGLNKETPTNSEFIAMIADNIRLKIENNDLKTNVSMFLKQFGFPADKKGYHYLRAAIMIEVNNPTIRDNGTNLIYALVANQYQTTAGPIENAITRAIHDMMYRRQDNADMINLYFGNVTWNWNTGSPENSDVIAILADALRSKLNSN